MTDSKSPSGAFDQYRPSDLSYGSLLSSGNLYQSVLLTHAELVEEERRRRMEDSSDVTEDRIHFAGFVPAF